MWKVKIDILIACLSFLLVWISLPQDCESAPNKNGFSEGALSSMNVNQLHSLVRDALKYLNKANEEQERAEPKIRYFVEPHYSGLVKLRAIRNGGFMEDMANVARLYQLQELENKFASKARPRFGKRAEVAQENFLPPFYGFQSEEEDENEGFYSPQAEDDGHVKHVKVPGPFLVESEENRTS